jgi:hypothetical protein
MADSVPPRVEALSEGTSFLIIGNRSPLHFHDSVQSARFTQGYRLSCPYSITLATASSVLVGGISDADDAGTICIAIVVEGAPRRPRRQHRRYQIAARYPKHGDQRKAQPLEPPPGMKSVHAAPPADGPL